MTRVCLIGPGRTGSEIAKVIMEQKDMQLVSVVCSPNSSKIGSDLGGIIGCPKTGITVESSEHIEQVIFRTQPDVAIDFTNPEAALRNAKMLSKFGVNMILGTTGFSKTSLKKLMILTRRYNNGILYAPNITLGVNVLMLLTNLAANLLNDYDFQITEIHHKRKMDSPSGTALKIAKEIEKGVLSSGLSEGETDISIHSIRAGGVVGKHEVMIVGENDKIEISHESFSRKAFALGALKGVKFINGKSGYFEMSDVLDLKRVFGDYLEKENLLKNKRNIFYGTKVIV